MYLETIISLLLNKLLFKIKDQRVYDLLKPSKIKFTFATTYNCGEGEFFFSGYLDLPAFS